MLSISFYFASSLYHSRKPLQNANLSSFRKEIRTATFVYALHYKNLRTALLDHTMLHSLSNLYVRGSKGLFPHERTWLSYLPPIWKPKARVKILSVTLISPYWIYYPLAQPITLETFYILKLIKGIKIEGHMMKKGGWTFTLQGYIGLYDKLHIYFLSLPYLQINDSLKF